jgi:hypothetical protein
MKQFQLEIFKGHPIIIEGEHRILIDTGAPSTIHRSGEIQFCGDDYDCTVNYMGLKISNISELLGMEITTLLGADILSEYKILFDYANKAVTFSKENLNFVGKTLDITVFMGIPILQMSVNNQELKFFLDTGARLSFLSSDITRNYKCVGTEEDFYPGVGPFQTDSFEVPTIFDGQLHLFKFGNLPDLLQMTLMLGGTHGIVGYDFFSKHQVLLDIRNRKLTYA